MCVYVYTHMYICVHIYIYVCVYVIRFIVQLKSKGLRDLLSVEKAVAVSSELF